MPSTESLRRDHELIQKLLRALAVTAEILEKGRPIPAPILNQSIEFTRNFMLVCHHGKEEEVLFPTLELNGMPREGGPIARMIFEHGVAKELAAKMESSATDYLSTGNSAALIADIRSYVDHVSSHLAKENLRLFAMADMILTATASELDKNLAVSEQAKLTDLGKDRKHYEDLVTGIESELVQT